jgi:phytoene synthase
MGALEDAYAECQRIASRHYENFPVASRLLPRHMRPHVAAVYAFARRADDFADEGALTDDERHGLLDTWQAHLASCVAGRRVEADASTTRIFAALGHTIASCGLSRQLLEDLLSAFRQDITTRRYETWTDLLDYCRRSANPVGRLVLRIAGYDDGALDRASDGLCTALQLTNFWQDLAIDWSRGRLYVPRELVEPTGAAEADLDARRWTPAWREAVRQAAIRTRAAFESGRPMCDGVRGRLRWELRLTWLGGLTILDRLDAVAYDVFAGRPTLRPIDVVPLLLRATAWRTR